MCAIKKFYARCPDLRAINSDLRALKMKCVRLILTCVRLKSFIGVPQKIPLEIEFPGGPLLFLLSRTDQDFIHIDMRWLCHRIPDSARDIFRLQEFHRRAV